MPETGANLVETRRYLEIQPAQTQLDPETVRRALGDLHQPVGEKGLLGGQEYPTYEFLLAATGSTGDVGTRSIDWYVGVTPNDHLEATRRALQRGLPAAYDIHEHEASYADLLDLPLPADYDPARADPEYAPLEDYEPAGVEYHGVGSRRQDWQCPLEPMETFETDGDSDPDWPFARLLDGLARGDAPALLQLLVEPKPEWTADRDARIYRVEHREDSWRQLFWKEIEELFGASNDREPQQRRTTPTSRTSKPSYRRESSYGKPTRDTPSRGGGGGGRDSPSSRHATDSTLGRAEIERIEALERADTRQSFTVNARAIALDTDADRADGTLRPLVNGYRPLSTPQYRVAARQHTYGSTDAVGLFRRLFSREMTTEPERRRHILPFVPNASPAIVAGPSALGALGVTGGAALSSEARRALETTRQEKTGLPLPPRRILNHYLDGDGMPIGHPISANRDQLETTVSLPAAVHPLHTAVLGSSGAGKTALGHDMADGTYVATDGATIVFDSKGDGGTDAFLRAHFARHGDLRDVYHFDCGDLLPAFSVLSIEPQLEAGIDRLQAVENVINGYLELLAGYMGHEDFHNAPASVAVIRGLLRSLFDPIHGSDTISQYELFEACGRMHRTEDLPTVSDPHLREAMRVTLANSSRSFDNIMTGAARRIRKASQDPRLRPLFEDPTDRDVAFDFLDVLDEQCVVIIDTSDYRDDPRQLLTLVTVAQLWTALKRRQEQRDPHADLPQVNLFVEEAADAAASDDLTDLLSKGRSFGVGVTLMMQFPQQVRDTNRRLFREIINDIGTHVTGRINDPGDLTTPFTTGDLDRETVATRIANLDRGDWLVRLADPFDEDRPRPRPFRCRSRALPRGHPDGDQPLTDSEETTYQAERTLLETRMARNYGITVGEYTQAATADDATSRPTPATEEANAEPADAAAGQALQTTIPHTERLPDPVTYRDEPPYPLVCRHCETRHPPTRDGMRDAIACCGDLADVDRSDVPITSVDLALTTSERHASDYTDAQLRFLAAVYMAHQQSFDPEYEYDLVTDSMVRLQEYVGIDTDAVRELVDDGLLAEDCDYPHRLYTVTPEGRSEIQVGHREGLAHGDGEGDLSESSFHVALTEVGARFLEHVVVADPDSPAVEVRKYHAVEDGRLDVAALDENGDVVVALEAERINNDLAEAVPADYDKMAACDPDEAIWVVKNRAAGHEVLQALNDPIDGVPRVEKTYSERMRPQEFSIDTPGLTDVYTFQSMRNEIED